MSSAHTILHRLKWTVGLLAVVLNVFIYFYPNLLNAPGQCNWHNFEDTKPSLSSKYTVLNELPLSDSAKELLLLNFPSLRPEKTAESSAFDPDTSKVRDIHMLTFGDPQINGNWKLTKYIKRLDNYGNDYYLGHIYNTMKHRLQPSHVAVMGDLFSSQWIYDSEFYNRTYRFVERLFPRPLEYKQNAIETHQKHEDYDWVRFLEDENAMDPLHRFNSRVYNDVYDWFKPYNDQSPDFENPLFINLTGNHDIGYSGDATWQHMARFHHLFGQNNYVINYNKGTPEEWRLVVLDSLTMEGPALQQEFLDFTWSFIENLQKYENPNFNGSTILFTHIPFFKREGLCADGPEHRYYVNNEREPFKNGLLRSQNHLSYETSQKVLDIVFPNADKQGIILTGHDHVGCDTWLNYKPKTGELAEQNELAEQKGEWVAETQKDETTRASIREIVVRSMMGDFEGQTGILTGHFNYNTSAWQFEFTYCSFVIQHWWWAAKVTLLLSVLLSSFGIFYGF